jgi:D-glycero-alpha-D-manno-heptose-7-phosphate kinase
MILTRTPLRISFVGGGSDRPSFYNEEPGACVAAAIDKYVYVAVSESYSGNIRAAYRQIEDVPHVTDLHHDLIREALLWHHITRGVEVHSIADVPGGTGLGSSSAFAVGVLAALQGHTSNRAALAADACNLEIDRCRHLIGKQDQYTAAYGGVNLLGFTADGVTVDPIACDLDALSSHCLLLDTGLSRTGDAGAVLASQQQDRDDVRTLAHLARSFASALASGNYRLCGAQMDAAWMVKREYCSTPVLDHWYTVAEDAGAWGGKLCGAGGGGFLLFLAPPERHQAIVQALGLRHVSIRVGVGGSEVVWAAR